MSDPEVVHLTEIVREMKTEMRDELSELRQSMAKLADAMVSIARIEVTQAQHEESLNRVFKVINQYEQETSSRLRALEENAPVVKLIQGWVIAWVSGVVGLVGGGAAMKVLGL